jgi:hypothetical protein
MASRFGLAAVVAAAALAGGCETLGEPVFLERTVLLQSDSMLIVEDLEEDILGGSRWVQYTAFNTGQWPFCAQVTFERIDMANGYAYGEIYRVDPGAEMDLAYIHLPARYSVASQTWAPQANGECGYPPAK